MTELTSDDTPMPADSSEQQSYAPTTRTKRRSLPWLFRHLAVAIMGSSIGGICSYVMRDFGM